MEKLEAVFRSLTIKSLTLRNRLVLPPMHSCFGTEDGRPTDKLINYYVTRAEGGVGLIIQEATSVRPEGKVAPTWLGIWDDDAVTGWRTLVDAVHEVGGKIAVQLHHAGAETSARITGQQPVAPSLWAAYRETPRVLTASEIVAIEDAFAEAAGRAVAAGYDAVEIHAAHGYLFTQFMSPLSNQRDDEYGGDFERRLRFARNVLAKIRQAVGEGFPILCRISGDEFLPGGITLSDSQAMAPRLVEAGADVIHVSGARLPATHITIAPMEVPHGNLVHLAEGIKAVVGVPVIAVGRISDVRLAEDVLRTGKADLVAMGRALIADPELPKKAAEGRLEDIRPCVGCLQGCRTGITLTCLANAALGRERELSIGPAANRKRVAVVGGGPGGLEAARVAALRGHQVTLFERGTEIGGRLRAGTMTPGKQDLAGLIDYLARQVVKLGVDVRLGEAATGQVVQALGADTVVVATGGVPVVPELPGVERASVAFAEDLLLGRASAGQRVIVMGAGMTGCEVAEFLAVRGKAVTIVTRIERDRDVASDLPSDRRRLLRERLMRLGVEILLGTTLQAVELGEVLVQRGEEQARLPADTVVLAQGYRPDNMLAQALADLGIPIHVIGDAAECRTAKEALREGFDIGRQIGD